jgi:ParB/RepB/Spo0J family partition protein
MPARQPSRDPFAVLISAQEPGSELAGARLLPLDLIDANPRQARQVFDEAGLEALARDIAERGIIQPITVRPHPTLPGRYLIIAGERRTRAARLAALAEVPVIIRDDLTETQAIELSAQENLQREDLDLIDEAAQYQALMEAWGVRSAREVARRLHRDPNRVQRVLRLAQYPALCQQVQEGRLTFRQALKQIAQPASGEAADYDDDIEMRHGDADVGNYDDDVEVRHGDATSASRRMERAALDASSGPMPFRWRPWQQFTTVLEHTRPEDVPPQERATFRAQLDQIEERVRALRRALGEE